MQHGILLEIDGQVRRWEDVEVRVVDAANNESSKIVRKSGKVRPQTSFYTLAASHLSRQSGDVVKAIPAPRHRLLDAPDSLLHYFTIWCRFLGKGCAGCRTACLVGRHSKSRHLLITPHTSAHQSCILGRIPGCLQFAEEVYSLYLSAVPLLASFLIATSHANSHW